MAEDRRVSRRQFLKRSAGVTAAGLAFPCIVPSTVLGRSNAILPSEKLTVGCVGMGGQGVSDLPLKFIR